MSLRVGWYTSMIGKKSSLRILLRCLRIIGVSHVFSTRFIQGKKGKSTVRWGVAWTFLNVQVPPSVEYNMSHKVFGLKKLRQRRDVCTNIRSISITDFFSTIDSKELLILKNFSSFNCLQSADQHPHSLDYLSLVTFLNTQVASPPTDLPISSSSSSSVAAAATAAAAMASKQWNDCPCVHCIFALSFLRVWTSLANHSSFHFQRVEKETTEPEERKRKRNSKTKAESKTLEIFFSISEISSVELCFSITAHLLIKRGEGGGEGEGEGEGEKRRRDQYPNENQPISKRTRIDETEPGTGTETGTDIAGTRWAVESGSDSEDEDEDEDEEDGSDDQEQDDEDQDRDLSSSLNLAREVDHLDFSISLNQIHQSPSTANDLTNVSISPALRLTISLSLSFFDSALSRMQFFSISEIIELDFLRTNRRSPLPSPSQYLSLILPPFLFHRWRRLLSQQKK
jgi:hypothetical protein